MKRLPPRRRHVDHGRTCTARPEHARTDNPADSAGTDASDGLNLPAKVALWHSVSRNLRRNIMKCGWLGATAIGLFTLSYMAMGQGPSADGKAATSWASMKSQRSVLSVSAAPSGGAARIFVEPVRGRRVGSDRSLWVHVFMAKGGKPGGGGGGGGAASQSPLRTARTETWTMTRTCMGGVFWTVPRGPTTRTARRRTSCCPRGCPWSRR